jgi:hypothetical protein
MASKEIIRKAYVEHVLKEGEKPKSVFIFAKKHKMAEEEFYKFYGSFDAIESDVWADAFTQTIGEIKQQEVWAQYSSREKALSFFYSFFEFMKSRRSFAIYSLANFKKGLGTPAALKEAKQHFADFANEIISEGLASKELAERKFISNKYDEALWLQFSFLLNFWVKDESAGFEKTDEAIEKGINVTFDLFQHSPIDNLLDYGKFLAQNSGFNFSFK